MLYHVGILSTHPIQYYSPWYRELAKVVQLDVFYCHRQSSDDHRGTEFGVAFEWDVPLLEGYNSCFLTNRAVHPDVSSFDGCDTPEIIAIIRENRFDAFVVHGWYTKSFWQAMLACWQTGTPLMVRGDSHLLTPRSKIKRIFKSIGYRVFIPRFDAYLVVGKRAMEYYLHYGADQKKMFFTPHAVDNQFFVTRARELRPRREELREEWRIPRDACVFLFAGKLATHKRPADFLKAIMYASASSRNIWGLVVGDGLLRAEMEDFVRKQQIPASFTGFLNQSMMPTAYAVSDVLVVPSDETWGLVVNEAMASGLPAIVADRVGCAPDLVKVRETGGIYKCGDTVDLANQMLHLAENRFRLQTLGQQAQRHIQHYSLIFAVLGLLQAVHSISTFPSGITKKSTPVNPAGGDGRGVLPHPNAIELKNLHV